MKSVKKVYYFIIIGLFVLYICLIIVAFMNLGNYIDANSSGVNDVTIVLDAGHGGEDGGAVANNIVEKDINLIITNKLADIFKSSGFNVVTTRTKDVMINSEGDSLKYRKISDMKNRLSIFNGNENNVVISIHQNKFTQEQYSGSQIFYSVNDEKSSILAESIKNSIVSFIQPDNTRECKPTTKDIYLLYNAQVPSVIVECGFISNYNEAQKLLNDEYQNKLAFSIFSGFLNYYNNS